MWYLMLEKYSQLLRWNVVIWECKSDSVTVCDCYRSTRTERQTTSSSSSVPWAVVSRSLWTAWRVTPSAVAASPTTRLYRLSLWPSTPCTRDSSKTSPTRRTPEVQWQQQQQLLHNYYNHNTHCLVSQTTHSHCSVCHVSPTKAFVNRTVTAIDLSSVTRVTYRLP